MKGTLVEMKICGILNWQQFCKTIGNFGYEDIYCYSSLVYLICTLLADCSCHADSISIDLASSIAL